MTKAKLHVIEDRQIEHLLKTTAAYSQVMERDTALLQVLYGIALTTTELATIAVSDYLDAKGSVRVVSLVRAEVAHNGEARPLYWSNRRVVKALDAYLAWRASHRQGVTTKRGMYRGLDPSSPIFLTEDGRHYSLTQRTLPSGSLSASSNALGALISRLHANAGIDGSNAQGARRAWAVKQYRKGVDLAHIALLLGHKSVSTTRRLVEDELVLFADIVARAI